MHNIKIDIDIPLLGIAPELLPKNTTPRRFEKIFKHYFSEKLFNKGNFVGRLEVDADGNRKIIYQGRSQQFISSSIEFSYTIQPVIVNGVEQYFLCQGKCTIISRDEQAIGPLQDSLKEKSQALVKKYLPVQQAHSPQASFKLTLPTKMTEEALKCLDRVDDKQEDYEWRDLKSKLSPGEELERKARLNLELRNKRLHPLLPSVKEPANQKFSDYLPAYYSLFFEEESVGVLSWDLSLYVDPKDSSIDIALSLFRPPDSHYKERIQNSILKMLKKQPQIVLVCLQKARVFEEQAAYKRLIEAINKESTSARRWSIQKIEGWRDDEDEGLILFRLDYFSHPSLENVSLIGLPETNRVKARTVNGLLNLRIKNRSEELLSILNADITDRNEPALQAEWIRAFFSQSAADHTLFVASNCRVMPTPDNPRTGNWTTSISYLTDPTQQPDYGNFCAYQSKKDKAASIQELTEWTLDPLTGDIQTEAPSLPDPIPKEMRVFKPYLFLDAEKEKRIYDDIFKKSNGQLDPQTVPKFFKVLPAYNVLGEKGLVVECNADPNSFIGQVIVLLCNSLLSGTFPFDMMCLEAKEKDSLYSLGFPYISCSFSICAHFIRSCDNFLLKGAGRIKERTENLVKGTPSDDVLPAIERIEESICDFLPQLASLRENLRKTFNSPDEKTMSKENVLRLAKQEYSEKITPILTKLHDSILQQKQVLVKYYYHPEDAEDFLPVRKALQRLKQIELFQFNEDTPLQKYQDFYVDLQESRMALEKLVPIPASSPVAEEEKGEDSDSKDVGLKDSDVIDQLLRMLKKILNSPTPNQRELLHLKNLAHPSSKLSALFLKFSELSNQGLGDQQDSPNKQFFLDAVPLIYYCLAKILVEGDKVIYFPLFYHNLAFFLKWLLCLFEDLFDCKRNHKLFNVIQELSSFVEQKKSNFLGQYKLPDLKSISEYSTKSARADFIQENKYVIPNNLQRKDTFNTDRQQESPCLVWSHNSLLDFQYQPDYWNTDSAKRRQFYEARQDWKKNKPRLNPKLYFNNDPLIWTPMIKRVITHNQFYLDALQFHASPADRYILQQLAYKTSTIVKLRQHVIKIVKIPEDAKIILNMIPDSSTGNLFCQCFISYSHFLIRCDYYLEADSQQLKDFFWRLWTYDKVYDKLILNKFRPEIKITSVESQLALITYLKLYLNVKNRTDDLVLYLRALRILINQHLGDSAKLKELRASIIRGLQILEAPARESEPSKELPKDLLNINLYREYFNSSATKPVRSTTEKSSVPFSYQEILVLAKIFNP